jgi:hypothetical protein
MDDLTKIESIVPHPGLADATTLAPERSASPLPSPTSELGSPGLPPNIIVSDNPGNDSTIIPATNTLTTRPTAGGIAYPFSLKVDGPDGKDVNASTLTLASVNITTPPAVDDAQNEEKQLGSMGAVTETVNEQILKEERPHVERYFTAGQGAGLFSSGIPEAKVGEGETAERPGVERFETAQDGLETLAAGSGKQ